MEFTNNNLIGKKVLFIAPKFFGYDISISNELSKQGAIVSSVSYSWGNYYLKLKKKILSNKILKEKKEIEKLINENSFDYLIVIKGEILNIEFINKFIN